MVAFSHLALAISAVTAVFAAPTADPDAPDFVIGPQNLARRQDYNQNYKTGGSVNFQPNSNGYSVTFSGAGDFVVGKGWKTGTTRYENTAPFTHSMPTSLLTFLPRPGTSPSTARRRAPAAQCLFLCTDGRGTRW